MVFLVCGMDGPLVPAPQLPVWPEDTARQTLLALGSREEPEGGRKGPLGPRARGNRFRGW